MYYVYSVLGVKIIFLGQIKNCTSKKIINIFYQFYATIIYKQINIDILTTHDTNFVKSGFSHLDGDQDIWLH